MRVADAMDEEDGGRLRLLEGVGHVSKNVRIKTPADIKKEPLRYYFKQALVLDRK